MTAVGDALFKFAHAAVKGAPVEVTRSSEPATRGYTSWNAFGLRDPVIHVRADGEPVNISTPTVFFNGRNAPMADGGRTCVGRLRWTASGPVPEDEPVFSDGIYAAAGSVVRGHDGIDRLFYSPNTTEGVAVASRTADGWRREGELLLRPGQFGCARMGLPYVTALEDGWIMVFEGFRRGAFALYAAVSRDGESWEPCRAGGPLYEGSSGSWDACGQANPSLVVRDGAGAMLFNGAARLHAWDVGALVTDDVLAGRWQTTAHPLLPRGAAGSWDGGRLEGARVVRAIEDGIGVLYFGLPGDDSYSDGAIGYAELRVAA